MPKSEITIKDIKTHREFAGLLLELWKEYRDYKEKKIEEYQRDMTLPWSDYEWIVSYPPSASEFFLYLEKIYDLPAD